MIPPGHAAGVMMTPLATRNHELGRCPFRRGTMRPGSGRVDCVVDGRGNPSDRRSAERRERMEKIAGFPNVGKVTNDPAALAEFYRDVLGMTIAGSSSADGPSGKTAFLSSRLEEEDHELAIFANPMF